MITMLQRHAVQVLARAGHTQREIASLAGVSVRSVRRITNEPPVTNLDTNTEKRRRRVGRPSTVEKHRDRIAHLLEEEPQIKTVEILHRLKTKGYEGGKTAVYEIVKALRPSRDQFLIRFEGLPGEFTQHDFGEVWVTFGDGSRRKIKFFASRLKYSRWVEVTLVENERVESLVRTLVRHFEAMGGVPLLAVFDRPRTIAHKWDKRGRVTRWNDTFAHAMLDLGVGVELCWPYRAQEKGSVENLVGWVKNSLFKQRRFVDMQDLLAQLDEWLREVNRERPCRATGQIPADRIADEIPRLRPVKVSSQDLALRFVSHVGPTGDVLFDGRPYSMPPRAIGLPATLYLYEDHVRIVAGRHVAEHERQFEPGGGSVLPEHRAEQVAAVSGERGRRYLKRQHLLNLGPPAMAYLTEVVHRRPHSWYRDVDVLHELLQAHGDQALRAALGLALEREVYGAEYVRVFLESPDAVMLEEVMA